MSKRRIALLLVSAAALFGCNTDETAPPAMPARAEIAPITTVVLDAAATAPVAVTDAPVDAGAPTATADTSDAAVSAPSSGPDFFSCSTGADCVAIPKNDCCHNGYKVAVNKGQVDAYRATAPQCSPRRKCPMFRILDRRVADCNAGKCVLVQPDGGGGSAFP